MEIVDVSESLPLTFRDFLNAIIQLSISDLHSNCTIILRGILGFKLFP
jgi:hypothetical protein